MSFWFNLIYCFIAVGGNKSVKTIFRITLMMLLLLAACKEDNTRCSGRFQNSNRTKTFNTNVDRFMKLVLQENPERQIAVGLHNENKSIERFAHGRHFPDGNGYTIFPDEEPWTHLMFHECIEGKWKYFGEVELPRQPIIPDSPPKTLKFDRISTRKAEKDGLINWLARKPSYLKEKPLLGGQVTRYVVKKPDY